LGAEVRVREDFGQHGLNCFLHGQADRLRDGVSDGAVQSLG
jgi:hypothetical protein